MEQLFPWLNNASLPQVESKTVSHHSLTTCYDEPLVTFTLSFTDFLTAQFSVFLLTCFAMCRFLRISPSSSFSVCFSICLLWFIFCLSVCLSLSVYQSVCLTICLSASSSICLSIWLCLSLSLSLLPFVNSSATGCLLTFKFRHVVVGLFTCSLIRS